MLLRLAPHPDFPPGVDLRVEARVLRSLNTLGVRYAVSGAIATLTIPPIEASARADELWRHTCFEAFFGGSGCETYYEFNFSPSTAWAAYRFDRYRAGMTNAPISTPRINIVAAPASFELNVELNLGEIMLPGDDWRLGLSAVLEESSGAKSYWALRHAAGKPDFHHRDAFAYEIAAAQT